MASPGALTDSDSKVYFICPLSGVRDRLCQPQHPWKQPEQAEGQAAQQEGLQSRAVHAGISLIVTPSPVHIRLYGVLFILQTPL